MAAAPFGADAQPGLAMRGEGERCGESQTDNVGGQVNAAASTTTAPERQA